MKRYRVLVLCILCCLLFSSIHLLLSTNATSLKTYTATVVITPTTPPQGSTDDQVTGSSVNQTMGGWGVIKPYIASQEAEFQWTLTTPAPNGDSIPY